MMKLFTTSLLAFAMFSSVSVAGTAAERLSSTEIRSLFPGSFTGTWQGQHRVTISAAKNGTLAGRAFLGSDTGVWSVSGQKLCVAFKSWTKNARHCGDVYKQGDVYMGFVENGKPMLQFQKMMTKAEN